MKKNNQLLLALLESKLISRIKKVYYLSFLLLFSNLITAQTSEAPELQGSWGVRLILGAGEELDAEMANPENAYDYVEGAQQIVDNYPTAGHVITNFTANADGSKFTLRTNSIVNLAEIDDSLVPSLANEQIIFDVIKVLKDADKKVILYLNYTNNMYRASAEQRANWTSYVNSNYNGDFFEAYKDLIKGFALEFKGSVDGYWVDNFAQGDNTQKTEFIQMLRDVDPNLTIAVNSGKKYFEDSVDSDGINDDNNGNYDIIKFDASNTWSDFTAGHITPLSNNAPPNSWGYEEFTITDMVENIITGTNGKNNVLKHMFTPIRTRWSSERTDIQFTDKEQVYRFIKRITDAGGAFTFSTTNTRGLLTEDELELLKYADSQFKANADYKPYVRPEGAFLVGETAPNYHQFIDFHEIPTKKLGDSDFFPFAYASSGVDVKLASSNTNVATIVNNKIRIVGQGVSNITASQSGNNTFARAINVVRQLTVNGQERIDQTITFNSIPVKQVGDADFSPATASSGFKITYTSLNTDVATIVDGKIHIVGVGKTNILANQVGSLVYNPAPETSRVLTVINPNEENLALNGTASQTSTSFSGDASLAIDGNTNGKYGNDSVTHTNDGEIGEWWQVVLDTQANINEIKIFNRTDDCCTSRLSNFTVFIGDGNGNWVFERTFTTAPNPSLTINNLGVVGKTIRIQTNTNDALSLAEVEVYGTFPECAEFKTIETEDYDNMSGIQVEASSDTGAGEQIGYINNGDWSMYRNIDLSCATSVKARVSSETAGGNIEVRLGSVAGTLIATIPVTTTNSWTTYKTVSTTIGAVSGVHNVYLVYTGGNGYLLNINSIEFSNSRAKEITPITNNESELLIYPNPVEDQFTISLSSNETANYIISDTTGKTILTGVINNGNATVNMSGLSAGLYLIQISNELEIITSKIVKQ